MNRTLVVLGVAALILAICAAFIGVFLYNTNAPQRLLIAIDHRDVEAARRELARGVDLNRSYDDGSGMATTPLMKAALAGDPEIVDLLLRAGADANCPGPSGWTPLLNAAHRHAKSETLELLIGAGADVSAAMQGVTVLHGAARHGNARSVRLLLEAGATVDASNVSGMTPLMWARTAGRPAAAGALIDAGANVHARDNRGYTPLMHAAQKPKTGSLVELLVGAGADVDARADGGRTALTYAAELCCVDAADALISSGADVDARDSNGKTPLMYIGVPIVDLRGERGEPLPLLELLLAAGADVRATDDQQRTVLWHARENGTWSDAIDRIERAVADER